MIAPTYPSTALAEPMDSQAKIKRECGSSMRTENLNMNSNESPFPQQLYEMLESASKESFEDVVSWEPRGRSFVVRKPQKFATDVLPM